jgi:hypothetical protein
MQLARHRTDQYIGYSGKNEKQGQVALHTAREKVDTGKPC